MGHFEVLVFRSQRTIHEITQSCAKHEPFRDVSCDLVDDALRVTKRIGALIELTYYPRKSLRDVPELFAYDLRPMFILVHL